MIDIVLILFAFAVVVQLTTIWLFHSKAAFHKAPKMSEKHYPPVSVVICGRNEHHNLLHHLKPILEQKYPDFEVVVVNDQSTDDSEFYLKTLQSQYAHLKVVNVKNPIVFFRGKKFPLSIGIKSAKNEIVVLTDADCYPASDEWLENMVQPYVYEGKSIVLGFGAYAKKKGFLNLIIRFEALKTAINYMGLALSGIPYMGVGRNLSYTKTIFFKNHGFQSHYKVVSGDDDLFVNQVANRRNTAIVFSEAGKTISNPKTTFNGWIQQKRRHLTTGKYYKIQHIIFLGLMELTYFVMLISAGFLVYLQNHLLIVIAGLILRYGSFMFILKMAMNKTGERNFLLISPLIELLLSIIVPIISMTNVVNKPRKWK